MLRLCSCIGIWLKWLIDLILYVKVSEELSAQQSCAFSLALGASLSKRLVKS